MVDIIVNDLVQIEEGYRHVPSHGHRWRLLQLGQCLRSGRLAAQSRRHFKLLEHGSNLLLNNSKNNKEKQKAINIRIKVF
jgi:hypothetical protein